MTPAEIAQLRVFENIRQLLPTGTFELIAKSPRLVDQLRAYSGDVNKRPITIDNTKPAVASYDQSEKTGTEHVC
jgi:hypothetical protein